MITAGLLVLGLLDFELPNEQGQYMLRDSGQGPAMDAALTLTQPSLRHGSKRTRGEELLADERIGERESILGLRERRERGKRGSVHQVSGVPQCVCRTRVRTVDRQQAHWALLIG